MSLRDKREEYQRHLGFQCANSIIDHLYKQIWRDEARNKIFLIAYRGYLGDHMNSSSFQESTQGLRIASIGSDIAPAWKRKGFSLSAEGRPRSMSLWKLLYNIILSILRENNVSIGNVQVFLNGLECHARYEQDRGSFILKEVSLAFWWYHREERPIPEWLRKKLICKETYYHFGENLRQAELMESRLNKHLGLAAMLVSALAFNLDLSDFMQEAPVYRYLKRKIDDLD